MTLRQKRSLFATLIPSLIDHAIALGYEITIGEVWRSPEEAKRLAKLGIGSINSLHCDGLAIDINLFKDGKYLKSTKSHVRLGLFWESLSTKEYKCCWGGHWGDGNHYSIEHDGRK